VYGAAIRTASRPCADVTSSDPPGAPSRRVRWFVRAFLAAFVLSAVAGIEAWPLTGWRLFSHLRTEHVVRHEASVVDELGRETRLVFGRLPDGYRGFALIVKTLPSMPASEAARTCRTWANAALLLHPDLRELRVYRLNLALSKRSGPRPASGPTRTLVLRCSPEGGTGAQA
jgi:hypothetical protein